VTALPTTVRLADPFPLGYVPPPRFDVEREQAKTVRRVREVVRYSGLVPFFEDRLHRRTGRPVAGITVEAILVTILAVACERQPMLITEFCDFLHHRLGDADRAAMGVTRPRPHVPDPFDPEPVKARATVDTANAQSQFRKRLRAMLDAIDPSPHKSKGRILDREIFDLAEAAADPAETERRRVLLDWVCNRLLEATWLTLPKAVRRSWNGSLALDATFAGTWARGVGKKTKETSADPDAWWWGRDEDHHVPDIAKVDLKAVDSDGKRIYKYGYDIELAIAGPDRPDQTRMFPFLVLGMTVHRPGFDPAKHCTDVLAGIRSRHLLTDPETGQPLDGLVHPDGDDAQQHPAAWLASDRAYTAKGWDQFALPVRALGYRPLMDYKTEAYGVQAEHKGMVLVEGRWYSPSITKALREATLDRKVRHTIDGETYRALIKAREPYAMRYRGQGTDLGDARWVCPAEGVPGTKKPPVSPCDRKEPSLVLLDLPVPRLKLRPQPVAGEVPEVCRTREVLALNNVHIKHQQDLPYESQEWNDVYHFLRSTVEGVNGTLKSDGVTGIDEPGNRRSTGLAATAFLTAFLVAAENLRKIADFYDSATSNDDGTMTRDLPRKKRKPRRKAPWMKDWLPDRVTDPAPAAPNATSTAVTATATAVAERDGPDDPRRGKRRPRPRRGSPPKRK